MTVKPVPRARSEKHPFDIHLAVSRIREAVRPFPPAAMFQLADEGYSSPFEQLVSCVISIRTYDEVSLLCARRLLDKTRIPAEMARLTPAEIDALISPCTFHERKAVQIREIARRVAGEMGGQLPCDEGTMLSFSGVGVKCAHLALGVACNLPFISVDIHVHRVTNRWGILSTNTPEATTLVLEEILPAEYRVEINRLLVPFGKHICTGRLPYCSTCPVVEMCQQVGVENYR